MVESTLSQYSDFFTIGGVFESGLRWLLFEITKLLTYISDGAEGIVDKIYTLNNFFKNEQVQDIYNTFKPVLWLILTLSVLYIGYKTVIDKEFKCERIFQNFILSSMVILALPTFMSTLDKITTESINVLNKTQIEEQTTTAKTLIKDNLYDLKYLESKNFKLDGYGENSKVQTNNIDPKNILKIPITTTMSSGFLNSNGEIYGKKLDIDENGEVKVVNMERTFFGLIKEEYYRYNIDFFSLIVSLICLVLAFVLTAIKIARIIVELAFKKMFAMTLAFGDVASGQKLKTILKDILSSFAVIFTTALLLKLYIIGISWVEVIDVNGFVKMFFLIGLSLMVIDAPNVIERILGIDAGIKSGWSIIAGAYTGAKAMGEIGKFASNMVGNATNTLASATGGAKGLYDGFKGSTLEDERKSSSSNSNETKSTDNLNKGMDENLSQEMNSLSNDDMLSSSNIEGFDDSISNSYGEHKSLSEDMNNISSSSEKGTLEDDISSDVASNSAKSTLETDVSSNEKGTLESDISSDVASSSEQSTLGSDISSSSESGTLESDINTISSENGTLETDIKEGNKLNGGNIEDKSLSKIDGQEKMANINNSDKSISDKNVLNNSSKIENKNLGESVKGKVIDKMSSTRQGQSAKKYYDIGVKTGTKLNSMLNKNKENK